MNRAFRVGAYAAVAIAIGIGLVYVIVAGEMSSTSYSSYEVAATDGAFGPGKWLPAIIPSSARNIEEAHDIDTNEMWFAFEFVNWSPAGDRNCKPISKADMELPPANRTDRFPKFARTGRDVVAAGQQVELFTCSGPGFDFYIAVSGRMAYGWSLGDSK